jgi:hypothetical protein
MNVGTGDDMSDCSSLGQDPPSIYADTIDTEPLSATQSPIHEQSSLPLGFNLLTSNDGPRRTAIPSPAPAARAQAVIIVGPPGLVFLLRCHHAVLSNSAQRWENIHHSCKPSEVEM